MKHAMLFMPERLSQLGWEKERVKAERDHHLLLRKMPITLSDRH